MAEITESLNFLDLLNDLTVYDYKGDPQVLQDALNVEMERLSRAAKKHHKSSELTLKITFQPDTGNAFNIYGSLNGKEPKSTCQPLMAYSDRNGKLFAEDPYQTKLNFENITAIMSKSSLEGN